MKTSQKIYLPFKLFFSFFFALLAILLLSWLLIIIALLIKLTSRGPIIFKQNRVGKNKLIFRVYKFRTMRVDAPANTATHLLNNSNQYITKVGGFLRKTSLDELPQLFNILKGDMAFVGPRPALWNQYDLIELRDKGLSNTIRPGLTGLAQIKGRDELALDIKANYDNYYAEHFSLIYDIKILLLTVTSVLFHRGVKEGGEN